MIFRKQPYLFDAWLDSTEEDESLLAFAVHEKIPLTLAIAHPQYPDRISQTTAMIGKQFIQDRFLQFDSWLPHETFSWTKQLSDKMAEIKGWLTPREPSPYSAISQMIWLNWVIVVHPGTAFLLSVGEIHTHLFRRREWQSWHEIPVDFAESDVFSTPGKADSLPSISVRQCPLYRGDILLMAHQANLIRVALCLNQKDISSGTQFAAETEDRMNHQNAELHLNKPAQSIGLIKVL